MKIFPSFTSPPGGSGSTYRAVLFGLAIGVGSMALAQSNPGTGTRSNGRSTLSFAAQQQAMRVISEIEDRKVHRSAVEERIDCALLDQMEISKGVSLTPSVRSYWTGIEVDGNGRVVVELVADVSDELLRQLRDKDAQILDVVPRFGSVLIRTPLGGLKSIAALPGVRFVSRKPTPVNGIVVSEGDKAHAADLARTRYGLTGQNVKVGVLSDSVTYLSNSQSAGELPNDVQVLTGQSGAAFSPTFGEGTAMLEIVHDLAPNSPLAFATAYGTEARFAQNILDLATAGCKVIVDDVQYLAEDAFQDDVVAQAVNTVTGQGVHYFSAAGNDGRQSDSTSGVWEGNYVRSATTTFQGHPAHTFGASVGNVITHGGLSLTMQWSDAHGKSANDYDLYLVNSSGNIVAYSNNTQKGLQDPFEQIGSSDPSAYNGLSVIVIQYSGATRYLRISTHRGNLAVSTAGATFGHACAVNANCIAAGDAMAVYPGTFASLTGLETYSSDGPRRMFYRADGTAYTANLTATGGTVRVKPDLTAADNVQTSVPGFQPFAGTSAAAPHAAAIAALLLQIRPDTAPATLRSTILAPTTWTLADPGAGAGIVNASAAANRMLWSNTTLAVSVASTDAGTPCTATISLPNINALPVNLTYQLSSNKSSVTVPATVTVLAGQKTATFTLTTYAPTTAPETATISAHLVGASDSVTANLTVNAALLKTFTLAAASVVGGNSITGTVTLSHAAPAGGVTIGLSDNSPYVTLPSTVVVPAGQTKATFVGASGGVDSATSATLTATYGTVSRTAAVSLTPAIVKTLTLTPVPSTVFGGTSTVVTGRVTLTGLAGPSGRAISVSSTAPSAASAPTTVTVPAGASYVDFPIAHHLVTADTVAKFTATPGGATGNVVSLTVRQIRLTTMTFTQSQFVGGSPISGTVNLNSVAPIGGLHVVFTGSPTSVAGTTVNVDIAEGQTWGAFSMPTSMVNAISAVTVTAAANGSTVAKAASVIPARIILVNLKPSSVKGGDGTLVTYTVTLNSPAPDGGTTVTLSSTNSAVAGFSTSTVTIPAGQTTRTFTVNHSAVAVLTNVTLRATLGNGLFMEAVLAVRP